MPRTYNIGDEGITEERQAEILAIFAEAASTRNTWIAARRTVDQHFSDHDLGGTHEHADLAGDGRVKPADECVMLPGRVPKSLAERRKVSRTKRVLGLITRRRRKVAKYEEGTAVTRRHQDAAVTRDAMDHSEYLHGLRDSALKAYKAAGHLLNVKLNVYCFPEGIEKNLAVDVLGDRLVKPRTEIFWPPPLVWFDAERIRRADERAR
jgi:hypothetical protein